MSSTARCCTQPIGTALARGQFARVPVINGITHDEELLFVDGLKLTVSQGTNIPLAAPLDGSEATYEADIAQALGVSPARAAAIAAVYPLSADPTRPDEVFGLAVSDASFACPALQVDRWTAARGVPTYAYQFNDDAAPGFGLGQATHGAELPYLFDLPNMPVVLNPGQQALAASMRTDWASFAGTGNPSSAALPWPGFNGTRVLSLVPMQSRSDQLRRRAPLRVLGRRLMPARLLLRRSIMSTSDITPTVVLVHSAFVDASSWNGVIAELKAAGLDVVAPPNLLRGVGTDAAYLTGFVKALGRPVVLAAHSYAGAVISQTGSDAGNVAGLVYIAAYAPEAGETLGAINARYPTCRCRPRCAPSPTPTTAASRRPTRSSTPRCSTTRCAPRRPRMWPTRWRARSGRPRWPASPRPSPARGLAEAAVLGGRGHRRSRHPPASRARHGQAGGQRDHRDRRLARGPGHASRRCDRSHRPRGQGHQMSASAAEPFGPVQRIAAGVLDIGYVELGPRRRAGVILLHGWPYDIHSYRRCRARCSRRAGYRVIVPYLRGYGATRFLSDDTFRNGQQSAVAVESIALMDALNIEQAIVGRLRLGRAHGRHHRGALAGALQGMVVGQRLSDRQPGVRPSCRCRRRPSTVVVPVLFRDRTRQRRLRKKSAAISTS